MIKVSVLYPNTQGCKFDMNYYLTRHMPMVQQKLGAACKRMAVEEGIAGGGPGAPATYVAMGHLYFDSTDAFQSAFAPHAQARGQTLFSSLGYGAGGAAGALSAGWAWDFGGPALAFTVSSLAALAGLLFAYPLKRKGL